MRYCIAIKHMVHDDFGGGGITPYTPWLHLCCIQYAKKYLGIKQQLFLYLNVYKDIILYMYICVRFNN